MRQITTTLAISLAAYAAGDVVGTKVNLGKFNGKLHSITVRDNANQGPAGQILLFDGDPGAIPADNAAFTWPASALAKLVGVVDLPTYKTVGSKKVGSIPSIGLAAKSEALYAVIVTSGTPTFAAVTDLSLQFAVADDKFEA